MSNPTCTTRLAETLESDPLAELALDLRWSFNHAADALWQRLDPVLWDLTHNPWLVLQTVSQKRLDAVKAGSEFRQLLDEVLDEKRRAYDVPTWFQRSYPHAHLTAVAYFSMEFMLTEALPIYSGGLGNVAGDQLKAASNLGVPIVGIGLLYQQGYFRQEIDSRGRQRALYPFNDPGQLPIRPLRDEHGEWVRFTIALAGSTLWIRAWQVQVGRVRLFLLDTNDPANTPSTRGITSELYGGDSALRLQQEIVLGIGGWRMLQTIRLHPEVCHLNEGHAALAAVERARCHMAAHQQPFEVALTITRAGTLFTTHTPVEAGFDRFAPELVEQYLGSYVENELTIGFDDFLALGRRDRHDQSEPFIMTWLALRGSGAVNGVSRLHGEVSRRIFQPLFPRWPAAEVPVEYVTNGVHTPTWDSAEADRVWESACGKDRWHWTMTGVSRDLRKASDLDLWTLRQLTRATLVEYVRRRLARQSATASNATAAATVFDSSALTIGFARRFATYKRPNLLLHDADRLARILTDRQRPVQLVIAGKAHPEDEAGQLLIEQWSKFTSRPDVLGRAVFLCDYDMLMAEKLVQGIDLWINTPRRPWEACGTSGMKVLVNGGLNLSELDGWWAEAYAPDVGWAIGDGRDRGDDSSWDATEAEALYNLLEHDIVPAFYTRDEDGIPRSWTARMRESMARLAPLFSANRVVRQYTEAYYLPAATAFCRRADKRGKQGREINVWHEELERTWGTAKFGALDVRADGHRHVFTVEVDLGKLDPEMVRVELYADGIGGGHPYCQAMERTERVAGHLNAHFFSATIVTGRQPDDFTPRLVPFRSGASIPLEAPFILWRDRPA